MQNLYDLTHADLTTQFARWGYSHYHVDLVWSALYRQRVQAWSEMIDVRADLLEKLQAEFTLPQPIIQIEQKSSDGYTRKYLLAPNGASIETVIMQFKGRYTACVSSQVGCAMGCVFCATGQMGYTRDLSAGEIVAQVLHVQRALEAQGASLRNIVLMGMGEPLHNYDNVLRAIDIITDHKGLAIAEKYITLSTVGLPHRIRQLADEGHRFRLAVSLHGATDAARMALVPPAKIWTLEKVMDACRYYVAKRQRRIFFEWALIAGKNDTEEDAHAVGRLLSEIDCTLNVIPLNPTDGYAGAPSDLTAVHRFRDILHNQYGIRCTIRQRRGIDIAAGCGQLATNV
jgi:23S rRNA (adenine2503-C2)-methyltransferase